jgi:hypothetical protein
MVMKHTDAVVHAVERRQRQRARPTGELLKVEGEARPYAEPQCCTTADGRAPQLICFRKRYALNGFQTRDSRWRRAGSGARVAKLRVARSAAFCSRRRCFARAGACARRCGSADRCRKPAVHRER